MKTDKELIKIWKDKEKSSINFWLYNSLTIKEKSRVFDLIK